MYDSVPHTRPLVVTGNPGSVRASTRGCPPLIQQRQSQYEGPTTILTTLADTVAQRGLGGMNFMAHLPHYAQLDEDFAGTARMLEVLSAYYDVPAKPGAQPPRQGPVRRARGRRGASSRRSRRWSPG